MSNPFLIEGPATISFSGGRTSGFMLRRILDAHGDRLPPDVFVVFANTGQEREETLVFVEECSRRWAVPIVWVERVARIRDGDPLCFQWRAPTTFRVVDFASAARNGEPFADLIDERGYLPNPVSRFCTLELKIRTMARWSMAQGYAETDRVIGLRADEMSRAVNIRARSRSEKGERDVFCPLADAGITKPDVMAFWSQQPFDLGLRADEGNCNLCFLKGQRKLMSLIRQRPQDAAWWIAQESKARASTADGGRFRSSRANYSRLLASVQASPLLPIFNDDVGDDLADCACTD